MSETTLELMAQAAWLRKWQKRMQEAKDPIALERLMMMEALEDPALDEHAEWLLDLGHLWGHREHELNRNRQARGYRSYCAGSIWIGD